MAVKCIDAPCRPHEPPRVPPRAGPFPHREIVQFLHGSSALSLKQKTLFVTGASRGIGLAIAIRAARDGANVAIAAKTETPHPKLPGTIHTAAEEIEAAGGRGLAPGVDVPAGGAVKDAIGRDAAHFGSICIAVY